MKKKFFILASVVLISALAATGFGGPIGGNIQLRIEQQQKRINQGVTSGKLTRAEVRIVQDNLDQIKAAVARATSNGRLTPGERTRLDRMLDRNDRMIAKEKNDPVRRID